MPVDNYTPEEAVAIATLRAVLGDEGNELLDDFIYRFLMARRNWSKGVFDIPAAHTMLTDHLEWRKRTGASDLIKQYHSPRFTEMYPCAYHGQDKFGNQVFFERPGMMNVAEMFKLYEEDDSLKLHCLIVETGRKYYDRALGGKGDGITVVMDLSGLGTAHINRRVFDWIRSAAVIDAANYPEHLNKCFIINAGFIFRNGWKIIKPMLDKRTASKVEILGGPSDYMPKLLEQMDESIIPADFGGKCNCAGGCLASYRFGVAIDEGEPGALSIPEREALVASGKPLPRVMFGDAPVAHTGEIDDATIADVMKE